MNKRDRFHQLKDLDNFKRMRNKTLCLIHKSEKYYYSNAVKNGTTAKDLWVNVSTIANNYRNDMDLTPLPSKVT